MSTSSLTGGFSREQAVPVAGAVDLDGAEQVGNGRRGQDHVGGDPVAAAVERLELPGPDVDGTDQQHRARAVGLDGEPSEVDSPLQHRAELLSVCTDPKCRKADRRQHDHVLKPGGPDDPGVDQLLQRRSGRVVGPEVIEQLAGARRVVLQQCRPGEHGAHRSPEVPLRPTTSKPASSWGAEQPLEDPGGEGGVAAAALAGDRDPGTCRIGHRHHCRGV